MGKRPFDREPIPRQLHLDGSDRVLRNEHIEVRLGQLEIGGLPASGPVVHSLEPDPAVRQIFRRCIKILERQPELEHPAAGVEHRKAPGVHQRGAGLSKHLPCSFASRAVDVRP
jgi:hypothetical protein